MSCKLFNHSIEIDDTYLSLDFVQLVFKKNLMYRLRQISITFISVGQQIKRFASPQKDVVDFGCGPGKTLPYLSEKFRTVYGYDFSDKLLESARGIDRACTR